MNKPNNNLFDQQPVIDDENLFYVSAIYLLMMLPVLDEYGLE